MLRRTALTLRIATPLALCAWLVAGPATGADPPGKAETAKAAETIKKTGKLPGGDNYWRLAEARYGGHKRIVPAKPFLKAKSGTAALTAGSSSLTTVGGEGLPPGFGKGFTWDRSQDEALLVIFVNAADPLGISIDGLQAGDQVQVLSASGIASFSEDKGNPLASSIVGLVAAGANVALGAAGAPEVKPLIDAAEAFAKDQFKATNAKNMLRDAFGVEPSTGQKSRRNGGLIVCLPEGGGTYYSGDWEHTERGIQGNGVRTDENKPAHVFGSFFPVQGNPQNNTRTVEQSGQMFILAWDYKFDDNAGFYKVFVKLKKGNGPPPVVIERKGTAAKPKKP